MISAGRHKAIWPRHSRALIEELALKIRITLPDQWGAYYGTGNRREFELFKLVDFGPRVVADADHLVDQIRRRDIDHAFLALADE